MESRDIEELERFLASVGQSSLLAYYGLTGESSAEEREAALKRKRAWAQGQQSNPKFKSEALFLIKQNAALRRALVEAPDDYRQVLEGTRAAERAVAFTRQIRAAVTGGLLTAQAEAEVRAEGRRIEMTDAAVLQRIEEVLTELGATRSVDDRADGGNLADVDLYHVLQVDPSATPGELEAAYRARYKWARNLNDIKRSQEELNQLDRAWRVLSDASRRATYDARRAEVRAQGGRPAAVMGLLGPAGPVSLPPTDPRIPPPDPEPDADTVVRRPVPIPPAGVHSVKPVARPPIALAASPTDPTGPRVRPELRVVGDASAPPDPTESSPRLAVPSDYAAEGERSDPRGAPPPPPGAVGRTLGVGAGPQDLGRRAPRLVVVGPDAIRVRASSRPSLTIRNAGSGRMPGHVTSDREWLAVPRPNLDPAAPEQVILLQVRPDLLPWGRDEALVTVVGDHGERKAVAFRSFRFPYAAVAAAVATFVVLVGAFVALFWYLSTDLGENAEIDLTVVPRADHVYINGSDAGSGATLRIRVPPPLGQVRVRVQTDGFEPWEQLLKVGAGEVIPLTARLDLADPMDWSPPVNAEKQALSPEAERRIDSILPDLARCYAGTGAPAEVSFTWTLVVDTDGRARKLNLADTTFPSAAAETCVRATFRALPLPPVPGGYALHQRRVQLTVPR